MLSDQFPLSLTDLQNCAVELRDFIRKLITKSDENEFVPPPALGSYESLGYQLNLHLSLADSKIEFLEKYWSLAYLREAIAKTKLTKREEVFIDPIQRIMNDLDSIYYNHINSYSIAGDIDLSNKENIVKFVRFFQQVCEDLLMESRRMPDVERAYSQCRYAAVSAPLPLVPDMVERSITASTMRQTAIKEMKSAERAAAHLRREFDALVAAVPDDPPEPPPAPKPQAGDWTGVHTIEQHVRAIRNFAPIALEALDEMIDLHQRILDNQIPTPAELRALSLLKRLHADLGALLAAVHAGRPFKALFKKVERSARKAFGMIRETQEIVLAGTPILAAAGATSLTAMFGLRLCGVDVGIEHAAVSLGLTATVYSTHKPKS